MEVEVDDGYGLVELVLSRDDTPGAGHSGEAEDSVNLTAIAIDYLLVRHVQHSLGALAAVRSVQVADRSLSGMNVQAK